MSLKNKAKFFWFSIFLCSFAASSMCLYSLWLNQKESYKFMEEDYSSQKILNNIKLHLSFLKNDIENYKQSSTTEALESSKKNYDKIISLLSSLKESKADSDQKAVGALITLAINNSKKNLSPKKYAPTSESMVQAQANKIEAFLKERHLRKYYHLKFSEIKKIQAYFLKEKKESSLNEINSILNEMDQGLKKLSEDSYFIINDLFKAYQLALKNYFSEKSEDINEEDLELISAMTMLDELIESSRADIQSHYLKSKIKNTKRFYMIAGLCGVTLFFLFIYYFFSMRMVSFFTLASNAVKENVENLNISISDAKNSFQELDEMTLKQGSTLNEMSTALIKMNTDGEKKNENITRSIDLIKENNRNLELAKRAIEKIAQTMSMISRESEDLKENFDKGAKELEQIISIIKEIADKNKVISDIVFQTKLLSFNASVEAARVGEAGKGFAVVTEEIGNLVSLSSSASLEISSILEKSISKIEILLKRNEKTAEDITVDRVKKIQEEALRAKECEGVFLSISEKGHLAETYLEEISHHSEEEIHRLNTMTLAVEELCHTNTKATEFCELSVKELMKVKNNADALLVYSHKLRRKASGK